MKNETKTSLATIAILLSAIAITYLVAFSNQIFTPSELIGLVVVGVGGGGGGGVVMSSSYDKATGTFSTKKILTLTTIFLLPIFAFIVPLSKHHNTNQLQRDTMITEAFEVTPEQILLPAEYTKHNSYLDKVLSIIIHGKEKRWKDLSITHTIGNKKWQVVTLPENLSEFTLVFNHCWQDKKETIHPKKK